MHRIIQKAKKEKRSLLETEAKELLREYGISVPDFKLIKSEEEVGGISANIGYPVVMKIVSISHGKSGNKRNRLKYFYK